MDEFGGQLAGGREERQVENKTLGGLTKILSWQI